MSSFVPKMLTPSASTDSTVALDQRQHQVEVVDHQVEDDADIDRSARERARGVRSE